MIYERWHFVEETERQIRERKHYRAAQKYLNDYVAGLRFYDSSASSGVPYHHVVIFRGSRSTSFGSLETLLTHLADIYSNKLQKLCNAIRYHPDEVRAAVRQALGEERLKLLQEVQWL